jgi:hypothetical protein
MACECYGLMQRRIDRMYCEELSAPRVALAIMQEGCLVGFDHAIEDRAEIKIASPERK